MKQHKIGWGGGEADVQGTNSIDSEKRQCSLLSELSQKVTAHHRRGFRVARACLLLMRQLSSTSRDSKGLVLDCLAYNIKENEISEKACLRRFTTVS